MIEITKISKLLGLKVSQLIFVVWPPFGEENKNDIDISVAFKFFDGGAKYISFYTDRDDNWTLVQQEIDIKKSISGSLFEKRINDWMEQNIDDVIDFEYFDLMDNSVFNEIVGRVIIGIEILSMKGDIKPFGVKFLFENDFLILLPNTDGSTVETKSFNCRNNISRFVSLGEIVVTSIHL
ncbi:MAG: hypothetical protein V4732_04090 [Pseudomonadota bacterium]